MSDEGIPEMQRSNLVSCVIQVSKCWQGVTAEELLEVQDYHIQFDIEELAVTFVYSMVAYSNFVNRLQDHFFQFT